MSIDLFKVGVIAYVLSGVIAFGHAYNNIDLPDDRRVLGAILWGMASPLYWSVQIFSLDDEAK